MAAAGALSFLLVFVRPWWSAASGRPVRHAGRDGRGLSFNLLPGPPLSARKPGEFSMKILVTLAAAAIAAGPALAQPAARGPDVQQKAPAASPHDHAGMSAAEMHEHCKAMMGAKMGGKAVHEHSKDKSGISTAPRRPLSKAEMQKMHEKCAAETKAK